MIPTTRATNWAQTSFLTRTLKIDNLFTYWHMVFGLALSQGKGTHCIYLAIKRAVDFLVLIAKIASKRYTTELFYIQLANTASIKKKKSFQHDIQYF